MRILLVDDAKAVHSFIKSCLSDYKVEIIDCYDGDEAIEFLKGDSQFDLIFLDWEMPKLSGPDTLEALKQGEFSLPVIMVTSKSSYENIEQMISAGAAEYVMKPFTKEVLVEKIEFVTGKKVA